MPRLSAVSVLAVGLASMLAPVTTALAADAGRTAGAGRTAAPAQDPHAGLGLPPGHPSLEGTEGQAEGEADDDTTDEELPPGHPPPAPRSGPRPVEGRLPEDLSETDSELAPGIIIVEARDPNDQPLAKADVNLGILQQSVAKGESRRRVSRQTDEAGVVRFEGLETGGGVAYRVTIPWGLTDEPATYAAMPFQLDLHHGQRVRVHVYPATHNINEVLVGMEAIFYMELKDDALQFDEFFRVYNVGAVTWVPQNVVVSLPRGFKAFNTEREMADTGFDEVAGQGAKLRGTFSPGRHDTHFRYQLPYDGDDSVEFSFGMPPHVAQVRVIAEASRNMELRADGFAKAVPDRNQRGQRVLVTERKVRQGESAIARLHVSLANIPTEGSSKWIATAITAATIAIGLYFATLQAGTAQKRRDPHESERARTRLVAEIAALERAHRAGEVGPTAYARIRDALIDSLARLFPAGES